MKYRTKKFSMEVAQLLKSIDKDFVSYEIAKQLLRSGMSVGANTRSAFRGRSRKEFIAKLGIVIEEADESAFWLELLEEFSYGKKEKIKELEREANQLVSIFSSISSKYKL